VLAIWKRWWVDHGTKITGFAASIAGTITMIDHETVNMIGQIFGPTWEPRIVRGILVLAGLITAHRGFTNTAKNNGPSN